MGGTGQRFVDAGYRLPSRSSTWPAGRSSRRLLEKFPRDWRFVWHLQRRAPAHDRAARNAAKLGPPTGRSWPCPGISSDRPHAAAGRPSRARRPAHVRELLRLSFSWDPAHFANSRPARPATAPSVLSRLPSPLPVENAVRVLREGRRPRSQCAKRTFHPGPHPRVRLPPDDYLRVRRPAKKYFTIARDSPPHSNGEYYASLVYKPMIGTAQGPVLRDSRSSPMGTPEDLEDYRYWHRAFDRLARWTPPPSGGPRLVMPMADSERACRFDQPKPLIPVAGRPMFSAARAHLPCAAERPVFVVRRPMDTACAPRAGRRLGRARRADRRPGETTQRALPALSPDEPVLVSAAITDSCGTTRVGKLLAARPASSSSASAAIPTRGAPEKLRVHRRGRDRPHRRVSVKEPLGPRPRRTGGLNRNLLFPLGAGFWTS